jgi:transitional endoplasmic reticulum ATPase
MRLTRVAQYWRNKLKSKDSIEFPSKLCDPMASITDDFSFAYLKEAFVATLLDLARNNSDDGDEDEEESQTEDEGDDELDKYNFWRSFKTQVKILRSEMGNDEPSRPGPQLRALPGAYEGISRVNGEAMPLLENMRLQGSSGQAAKAASLLDVDAGRLMQDDGMFDLSPVYSFAPLANNKRTGSNAGGRGWDL